MNNQALNALHRACSKGEPVVEMPTPAGLMRRDGTLRPFHAVALGASFEHNGCVWAKYSTRTARVIWPAAPNQSHYFQLDTRVYA